MPPKTLIFIPTYNERENAPRMCEEIHKLGLDADLLFVDDNSPDGTGKLLDELKPRFPRLIVHHRSGKLGIGSAHLDGIAWAYEQGYTTLVTLDCDFTHSPSDIPKLLASVQAHHMAVGSRWLSRKSLPGWNLIRRSLTSLGHLLTKHVLGIPQDASGAFRAYRLDRIPRGLFDLVQERGYAFFFESLFIVNKNRLSVAEIPIVLPARTYGHSKMDYRAAWRSARFVFILLFRNIRRPEQYLLDRSPVAIDPNLADPQDWDTYWTSKDNKTGALYEIIAGLYRRTFITANLEAAIAREFAPRSELLHAGCGSGQVDVNIQDSMRLTALDISPGALRLYARNNPKATLVKHGSILQLPFPDSTFDGVYNLGVMEHFTSDEIATILAEFRRVLKHGGKILIFWPHVRATSVFVLKIVHFLLNSIGRRTERLHPAEISYCQGKIEMDRLMNAHGFAVIDYRFGPSDLFIQAIITALKSENATTANGA